MNDVRKFCMGKRSIENVIWTNGFNYIREQKFIDMVSDCIATV